MRKSNAVLVGMALAWSAAIFGATADDDFQSQAIAERLLAVTGLLPSHALILELQRVADDPAHELETRERALARYALGLRDYAPDPAAWAGLEFLSAYQQRASLPHSEAKADQVPGFNVAASARGTINQWLRATARQRAASELEAGRADFLEPSHGRVHPQQIAGIVDALAEAGPGRLAVVREALLSQYPADPQLAPIALAVARLLGDEVLLERVIAKADSGLRFKIIYELDRYLDAGLAAQRWRELAAEDDPELAGPAIAALVDKSAPGEELFELLAGRLGEPEIGVAAADALGRMRLPAGVPRLAALLQSEDAVTAARAALALKLNGSPAALAALRASPLNEVHQWLR